MSLDEYFGGRMPPAQRAMMNAELKRRAGELGLPMEPPATLYNTHRAQQLAEYARDQGRLDALHLPLFQAYFVAGENLSDDGVLGRLAGAAGLDPEAALAAVRDGRYEQRLEAYADLARRYGISSVPTFILKDRYKVVGAQPYERLRAAFLQVMQEG